jgi:hypothetical protein
MRQVWAATLASVSLAVSNSVFAQEVAPSDTPDSVPSRAVRLSDAELDEVTAGAVLTVIIAPPSNASQFHQGDKVTVLILGTGKGNDIFGSIVLVTDRGVKLITIPGGH